MSASKIIEEGFLIMKTSVIAMLLGLSVAFTAPVFGVTDPFPSLQKVEADAAAEAAGKEPGVAGKTWGWLVGKKTAVVTSVVSGVQNAWDPEKKLVSLKAQKKELLAQIQGLKDEAIKRKVGSAVKIDTLKGCAVDLSAFLETLEPE
jgi:hypothetical protein